MQSVSSILEFETLQKKATERPTRKYHIVLATDKRKIYSEIMYWDVYDFHKPQTTASIWLRTELAKLYDDELPSAKVLVAKDKSGLPNVSECLVIEGYWRKYLDEELQARKTNPKLRPKEQPAEAVKGILGEKGAKAEAKKEVSKKQEEIK